MEDNKQKDNIKKLLCYNIVNNSKCVYKNKCMFAHTLCEQKKEPIREYIYNMIYEIEDLSDIDIYEDKTLYDELTIYTKECKNCFNKKCPGGYNCKFGSCSKDVKICYNDMMYGRCYNYLKEEKNNLKIIKRCIHGVHLTEKNLIPYYQRVPLDIYSEESGIFHINNINFNTKNNTISMILNDKTIKIAKDIINKKMTKNDIIKYYNTINKNNFIESDILEQNEIEELRKYKFDEYYNNFNELMINKNEEEQYYSFLNDKEVTISNIIVNDKIKKINENDSSDEKELKRDKESDKIIVKNFIVENDEILSKKNITITNN